MNYKLTIAITALIAVSTLGTAQGPTVNLDGVLIDTDPYPVESGEDAETHFKVRNTGNTVSDNVNISIIDSYPFELKPDRKRSYEVGKIFPGESYYITSEVLVAEEAPEGENSFKVRISNGDDYSQIEKIPVQVQNEEVDLNLANLKTTPSTLRADTEDNKLGLDIVNNGEKEAKNVVVNLDMPSEMEKTSSFSTRQSLGTVNAGETKTAEFNFDIIENASKGELKVPATVEYRTSDDSRKMEETKQFSVFLSGKPRFEVTSISSELTSGQDGTIELTVKNTGSEKSSSTRARVLENSDLPFSFDSSNKFMGSLRPGDTGTVLFETDIEKDAVAKQYLLDFELRGVKDEEVFVEEKTRSVEVKEAEKRREGTPLLPIGALIVVIASGAYYFRGSIQEKLGGELNREEE